MRRWLTVAAICFGSAAVAFCATPPRPVHRAAGSKNAKKAATAPAVTYDVSAVNNPSTSDPLEEKSAGSAALRAEILLDRAHFSVGQIDGRIGVNALHAVEGFRIQRGLPAGSGVDQNVWQALNQDTAAPLVPYTITAEDLKGPFVQVPADMMAKAKLPYLGYASPLDEIAEKFHISPALLQRLNAGKKFDKAGEEIMVPNVGGEIQAMAAKVVVSKSQNTVTALDDQGKIIAQYPCTSGSEHDPLPIGDWKIVGVARNPKFHYNPALFWDAKAADSKTTIAPGPRNPVGPVWIDLSKEHYGIHGTPDPSRIGYSQSHGCIRLTNWDALQLASMVKPGTPASLLG